MNTTTLARPSQGSAGVPADRRRAVLALARVEGIRLLRHPITIAAVLLLVGIWVSGWFTNEANRFPILQDVDRETGLGVMLLLGGAALIASNLAVLRPHRTGTAAFGDVLVLPYPLRTAAHLLALLPLGLLAAVLAVARVAVLAIAPAAGRPNPYELATGPATVLLLGALGVLFGRLTRSAVAAPLALLGLLATLVVFPLLWPSPTAPARWFQPVVPDEAAFVLPAPVHLMARPAGPHLVYLIGLIGLVAVVALARGGTRTARTALAAAVALAIVVVGGILQTAPPSRSVLDARMAAQQRPSAQQTCQTLGPVTYCAFPDFTRWIPSWDVQVRGVLRRVPAAQAQQPIAVRQRTVMQGNDSPSIASWTADDLAAGTPNAVTVDTRWGDSRSAARLAGLVAYRVVTGQRPGIGPLCGARRVVVAWLAGQASGGSRTGLRLLADQQGRNGGEFGVFLQEAGSGFGVLLPHQELTMALALLDRPADEVGARVLAAWAELIAPGTTTQRAGEILGVPVPPAQQPGAGAPQDRRDECP